MHSGIVPACRSSWVLARGTWLPDLTMCGDIHPHPGPRPKSQRSSAQVWSVNVGRGNGAWEAFNLAKLHEVTILALQEDGLKGGERNSFVRHVCKSNYRIYDAPPRTRGHQAWGGAMLIVHNSLRSVQIDAFSCDDCQAVSVRVENITFCSLYQVPTGMRLPLAQHLTEMQVLLPSGSVFVAVGDYNDTPFETCLLQDDASPGLSAIYARDADGNPAPTRWQGTRCIDFLISNSPGNFQSVELLKDEAISDHKVLKFEVFFDAVMCENPFRLHKHINLVRPSHVPKDVWLQHCEEYALLHPRPSVPAHASAQQIDALWMSISAYCQNMLAHASRKSLNFSPDATYQRRMPGHPKGSFKVTNEYPLFGKLDHAVDNFRIRKIRNFLAQLRELQKLGNLNKEDIPEFRSLVRKTNSNPLFDPNADLLTQIRAMEALLKHEREQQMHLRLKKWRHRLQQSVSACHAWLTSAAPIPFKGLFSEGLGRLEATSCLNTSLLLLRDYWKQVWDRPDANMPAVQARISSECRLRGLPPVHRATWTPLTAVELASRASALGGKAAGLDGWSGDEICSLSTAAFRLFADFCACCEASACLPSQWQLAKQCHLPKANKGLRHADGARDVSGLRPLSVFSSWYRLWASARLRSRDATTWCDRWWPKQAIGGKKRKELYNALAPLFDCATKGEYLISLDFSLAFDYCDPRIAAFTMRKLGLPDNLCGMLSRQWTQQLRLITLQGCYLPNMESASKSLPQGDPFSLLAMVAVLTPCTWEIERCFPSCTLRTFVDDRTFACASPHQAFRVLDLWRSWCDLLQLRENENKTQFFHKSIAGRRVLASLGAPADKITDRPVILGTAFRGAMQRRHCDKEASRIDDVVSRTSRAAFLPVPWRVKRMVVASGPLAQAEFGWTQVAFWLPCSLCGLCRCSRIIPGLWDWNLGWSASLNHMMKRYGWDYVRPWVWEHSLTNDTVSLNKRSASWNASTDAVFHQLREGFRAHCWSAWQRSTRNDAFACRNVEFCPRRCKLALKEAGASADRFAILTGAFCSPAAYAVATRCDNNTCPVCRTHIGHTHHMYWECPGMRDQRPRLLVEALQARLGWPRGLQKPFDESVLAWMVHVRKLSLSHRYGDVT